MSEQEFQEFLSMAIANNRELSGLPPQSATFCCLKDPNSPRVCDRWRGHDGNHYDSTMPTGATARNGTNKAIEALRLEKEQADPPKGERDGGNE